MQAKRLRELLNNTKRTVADYGPYIAVGSALCHDLIRVDKDTMLLRYALDSSRGREGINDSELEFVWDKLHDLIESGELREIIDGDDDFEGGVPVHFFDEDKGIVKEFAEPDKVGYPHSTNTGRLMYENTTFLNEKDAAEYGIRGQELVIKWSEEAIVELNEKLEWREGLIEKARANIEKMQRHL